MGTAGRADPFAVSRVTGLNFSSLVSNSVFTLLNKMQGTCGDIEGTVNGTHVATKSQPYLNDNTYTLHSAIMGSKFCDLMVGHWHPTKTSHHTVCAGHSVQRHKMTS